MVAAPKPVCKTNVGKELHQANIIGLNNKRWPDNELLLKLEAATREPTHNLVATHV